jgi:phosphoribosylanthranilate isomerase
VRHTGSASSGKRPWKAASVKTAQQDSSAAPASAKRTRKIVDTDDEEADNDGGDGDETDENENDERKPEAKVTQSKIILLSGSDSD